MIQEEYPASSRQEAVEMVLKAISEEPSAVLVKGSGTANARRIAEFAEGIIQYINTGKIPIARSEE